MHFILGTCYGLDLIVPQRLICYRLGLQLLALLGSGGTFKKWGLAEGVVPSKGILEPTPCFLFASHSPQREHFPQPYVPCHDVLPRHSPKGSRTETSITVS
jgi:hypothetical protein